MSGTTNGLSVEYFRQILAAETKKLNELCEQWSQILEETSTVLDTEQQHSQEFTEEQKQIGDFEGAIRTTIGQAKLLMSQRFKQFNELIDNCEFNTGQHITRLDDLSGFWDMVSFQVTDVRQKFKALDEQRFKCQAGEPQVE